MGVIHRFLIALIIGGLAVYAVSQYDPLTTRDKIERAVLSNDSEELSAVLDEGEVNCQQHFAFEWGMAEPILIYLTKRINDRWLSSSSDKLKEKYREMVGILVSRCIGINDKTQNDGITALQWAMSLGDEMVARRLIEFGANLNAQDSFGRTALFYSERFALRRVGLFGDPFPKLRRMATLLVENGADPNVLDEEGRCVAMVNAEFFTSVPELRKLLLFERLGLTRELCEL